MSLQSSRRFFVAGAMSMLAIVGGLLFAREAGAEPLRLACNHFPPQKISGPPGGRPGYDVEIIQAIAAKTGDKVEVEFYPWNRALALAVSGEVDGLCSCSRVADRDAALSYGKPIGWISQGVFSVDPKLPPVTSLTDLKGQVVGTVAGYNLFGLLRDAGAKPVEASDDATALAMLQAKRFERLFAFRSTIEYIAATKGVPRPSYTPLQEAPYYVCFSRKAGDADARSARFDAAFAELNASGVIDTILAGYGIVSH